MRRDSSHTSLPAARVKRIHTHRRYYAMRLTTSLSSSVPGRALAAGRIPPAWALAGTATGLALVFALDRATGSAPMQHLYYLPIILAAVSFGLRGGFAAAAAAIVLYHLANTHLLTFQYSESDLVQVTLFAAVGAVAARLARDARRLQALAMTDDLTGLHNLRSFEARLDALVRAARRSRRPMALLVLDVDRLKALNDAHGHLAGAEAVRLVGHLIAARAPDGAIACRYGGDEFVIALADATRERAEAFADDLRRTVHDAAPELAGRRFQAGTLSVSIGIACQPPGGGPVPAEGDRRTGETLFRSADSALYAAKAGGRNQVHAAEAGPAPACAAPVRASSGRGT